MAHDLPYRAKRSILIFFVAWLVIVLAAPFTLPANSVLDLSGRPGVVDNSAAEGRMNLFAQAVYVIGDVNCHQIKDRSFFLNGNEMPFCSRDVGIFFGLAVGMLIVLAFGPKFYWLAFIAMTIPILVDGGLQLVSSYESNNLVRFLTGAVGGAAVSYLLGYMADQNLSVKRSSKGEVGKG